MSRTGALQRGEANADALLSVSELFRDHHLELVRLAVVMVGDVATAEDVVQDCFERLHRRWHVIREPSRALAYARSSVLNGCRSVHRRSAVSRRYAPRLAQPADTTVPDAAAATADRGELAAGASTIWSTRAGGAPFNTSWAGDKAVAFEWQPSAVGLAARYRVLRLSGRPADLLADSQLIASPSAEPNHYVPNALVTPDGRTVITSEVVPFAKAEGGAVHGAVARIVALNARTGHLERTLYTASATGRPGNLYQDCNVLSLGPGGRHPLVDCFSKLGALVDGQIVSLPGFPSPSVSGIADQRAIAW